MVSGKYRFSEKYKSIMDKLKKLCFFARYLSEKELIIGSEGNISIRDKEGFWITPSNKIKELLDPKDISFVNWKGIFIKGNPSSEWGMHWKIYLKNPSAQSIIHTHPIYVLLLDFLGFDFDSFVLSEAKLILNKVKVLPYLRPGSEELWDRVADFCESYKVIILSKHGVVSWGKNLEEAANLTLILEKICKIEYLIKILEDKK